MVSPASLDSKILSGTTCFDAKQNIGSRHPKGKFLVLLCEKKGRLTIQSLKKVSCCPSDHPRVGNMGA